MSETATQRKRHLVGEKAKVSEEIIVGRLKLKSIWDWKNTVIKEEQNNERFYCIEIDSEANLY